MQSTANKPKRVQHSTFCDTLSDVILTGKYEVKIERYPCRCFRKVGEQHHNKGYGGFVLTFVMRKAFNSSLTCQAISLLTTQP